jgi:hypothetical protein
MKGFTYSVTTKQIRRHQARPVLEKLQLLEELIQFNFAFASPKAKAIQRLLRQGKSITKNKA